jgi:hypothetical protein
MKHLTLEPPKSNLLLTYQLWKGTIFRYLPSAMKWTTWGLITIVWLVEPSSIWKYVPITGKKYQK